jgi:hypothetical protein
MSQRGVERIVGRLVTDPGFREAFFRNPVESGLRIGADLTRQEIEALRRISLDALVEFSDCLDDRICRLHIRREPMGQESRK